MAANIALSVFRSRSRQYADQVNSSFTEDTELDAYINDSLKELYDQLVAAYDDDYYLESDTITTVPGTESYALPADFYKLLLLEYGITNTERIPMDKYSHHSASSLRNQSDAYPYSIYAEVPRYRLKSSNVHFLPVPGNVSTIYMDYIPAFTELVADSDTFDGVNGWEMWAYLDVAFKMMAKEETEPPMILIEQYKRIQSRIDKMKKNRDLNRSGKVVDTRSQKRYRGLGKSWQR